jgi:UDP-N-acetylglucosamine 2-epimerase (non-hydrolysing)
MADASPLPAAPPRRRVLTVLGTRPEVIKLAPVIRELQERSDEFESITVASGQHTDLLAPFVKVFDLRIDHQLQVMLPGQPLNVLASKILAALDPVLEQTRPDAVLVQGDTTTALGGALAAYQRGIPVGHIEAGLRTGDSKQPFPEEMNRRLISRLAAWHFAATSRNRRTLLAEGVDRTAIAVTGNPVVDSLKEILEKRIRSPRLLELLEASAGLRRVVLTTHRRENFGKEMAGNLRVLAEFVERQTDVGLIFPVHPNPAVRQAAEKALGGRDRMWLVEPLDYLDFIGLLSECWLIVSDSGGIQEEAPTLGKPLLVLRELTERPEAVECGIARLVGGSPYRLEIALKDAYWRPVGEDKPVANPFGRGDSARQIADALNSFLNHPAAHLEEPAVLQAANYR